MDLRTLASGPINAFCLCTKSMVASSMAVNKKEMWARMPTNAFYPTRKELKDQWDDDVSRIPRTQAKNKGNTCSAACATVNQSGERDVGHVGLALRKPQSKHKPVSIGIS